MNRNSTSSQSGIYYVIDGSRKRRIINNYPENSRGNTHYDFSKNPPKAANGNGEPLSQDHQRQHINKFREQMSFVSNALIKGDPPIRCREDNPSLSRNQRYEIQAADEVDDGSPDEIIPEEDEFVYESTTTSSNPVRDHPQRPSYWITNMMVEAPERPLMTTVDPSTCTDVALLRESLHHANACLIDLVEQQKKQKRLTSIWKARFQVECNKSDDFQRILLERNLRMKQVVSENVRWGIRYSRLKQHFGDEDVIKALGDLAPK